MQLFYTPRSHYSRKIRILLGALELGADLIDVGNVAGSDPAQFGTNPLMKVPILVDGARSVFDSDHIAAYIVRKHDPFDRFDVLTTDTDSLNARAVMNGVMASEVELILAARTGIDTQAYRRFDKLRESIHHGLSWLDAHCDRFPQSPSYLTFHLVSMWDHLALYKVAELEYARLRECALRWAATPYIAATRPP